MSYLYITTCEGNFAPYHFNETQLSKITTLYFVKLFFKCLEESINKYTITIL